MRNFAKLQKSAKLQKNAISYFMQFICIGMRFCGAIKKHRVTRPLQRDRVHYDFDFKEFLKCDKRDTTASAGSVTQPPLPPLGGRGLSRPSRHGFLFTEWLYAMWCQNRKFLQKRCGGQNGSACCDADGRERPALKNFS
ncbi:TPA: hypothetical protein ACIVK9_005100 [Salmonella enterica subsp. enterica serovar Muenchen]